MNFFSSDPYGSNNATTMCIGQLKHLLDDEELLVPSYQREYVWTKKQKQGYLQTLSQGAPLFGPIINIDQNSGKQYIMDGQNRLFTIYYFLKGDISFENEEGDTIVYSNLAPSEQRKLNNTKISYIETRDWTKEQCQEFFMNIQGGEKLKDGELIHAKSDNPLTREIQHIYSYFVSLFNDKARDGGLGLTPGMIHRFGHYEIIGTIIHMVRTSEYPIRPGKTALKEFKIWADPNLPTPSQRDVCITETKECLNKYSQILLNVPRLRTGVKKEEHLRLLYFIHKSRIYREELTDEIYSKIDILLNRVLNKDNPEYNQIVVWGTGGVENIYELYLAIYNQ